MSCREFDLGTGAFKVKKPKKEKSPAEMAVTELKKLEKKTLVLDLDLVPGPWFPYLPMNCLNMKLDPNQCLSQNS